MTPEEKAERLREGFDTFARQDVDDLSRYLADDVTWNEPSGSRIGGDYAGRKDVAERLFATVPKDWEEFSFDIHDVLYSAEHTMVLANWQGRSRHTGNSYHDHLIFMAHVGDDGLIRDVWATWSTAETPGPQD